MNSAFAFAREKGIKSIRLMIHQPRVSGTTEWTCSLEDLERFADTLRSKVCSAENAARDYGNVPDDQWQKVYLNQNPNEQDCAFCRAMPTCPSARRKVEETVGAAFEEITDEVEQVLIDARTSLKTDHLAAAMAAAGFIEDWIKSVRAEVERRLLAGQSVEGFGLELGRQGPRKWRDEQEAEEYLRGKARLKIEHAFDFSLKGPTQIEKLAKPTKDEAGTEVPPVLGARQWKKVAALITRSDPKPSVKPADKIKNPYTVEAPSADAFEAISEEEELF